MPNPGRFSWTLPIQADHVPLLDMIDRLRTLGVGELVSLPQMIVCGSKSNGKRSIIEALCRVDFPVNNDLYTGFVIEIISRRHPTARFKVSIEPGPSRKSETDLQRLRAFEPTVHANAEQSASLIEEAAEFLGSFTEDGFSDDIIKVEVTSPDQPDLTLIDVPGCYFTEDTLDSRGKNLGHPCMEKYMLNPRSVILAVISAKIDICVQKVLHFADKYDKERNRIMGIVTHLDKLETSSDEETLWRKGIKQAISELPLGLHLVCTRSYETRDDLEELDEKEKEFFDRTGWKTLAMHYTGTRDLRRRLNHLFMNHIQSSLPGLISEINKIIPKNQTRLAKLSTPRETINQQKAFLFHLSSDFHRITEQALNGMYTDGFFATSVDGDDDKSKPLDPRRLRSIIRDLHEDFADIMEAAGCRQFIHGVNQIASVPNPRNPYADIRQPIHRSRSEFELEASEQMRRDRGIELPSNANQLLAGTLFRDQSQPWEEMAQVHLMKSWECALDFVTRLLEHLADERMSVVIMQTIICPQLDRMEESLLAKLQELTAYNKRGHPLPLSRRVLRDGASSLDRCIVTKMQKSKNDRLLANLQQMRPSAPGKSFNMEELKAVTQKLESSSIQAVASDVVDQFQAYYENALLTFMDNIATLGIENCLLHPLETVLTTQTIANMEDKQIEDLFAGVHDGVQKSRDYLTSALEKLQIGLRELKKFYVAKKEKPPGGIIKAPVSGPYARLGLPPYLSPLGIICTGAPFPLFGEIVTDDSIQGPNGMPGYRIVWPYSSAPGGYDSAPLCPSGPFGSGADTATVPARTVPAPSAPSTNPNPEPNSHDSEAHTSFRHLVPPASTFDPSTFFCPPGRPAVGPAPTTRGYDPSWYLEEFDGKCVNRYYSVCLHNDWKRFSQEELRLADYQFGTITSKYPLDPRLEEMKAAARRGMKRASDLL